LISYQISHFDLLSKLANSFLVNIPAKPGALFCEPLKAVGLNLEPPKDG